MDSAPVDQTSLPALYEHFAQQLLVVLTVQLEGLREHRIDNQRSVCVLYLQMSMQTHIYLP